MPSHRWLDAEGDLINTSVMNTDAKQIDPATLLDPNVDLSLRYAGLIFDCDGTLSHSMPLHFISWRDTLAKYGIEFPEDRFYSLGGMPSGQIIDLLSDEQNKSVPTDQVSQEKEAAFVHCLESLKTVEPVCEQARKYAGKIPAAVASGGIRSVIDRQLQLLSIDHLFQTIVTAEDTTEHKPHPAVFLEAARRLDVEPNRCLVFEDSPLGFEAATRAGMDFIDVRSFYPSS